MKEKSAILKAKEAFMELYNSGHFPANTKLPSENEMAHMLGVSRETWRKVLKILKSECLLISRHGSGTYVLPRGSKFPCDLSQLHSMSKMLHDCGIEIVKSETNISTVTVEKEIADFFSVPEDTEFLCVQKLRYSEDGAICLCINYLPIRFAEKLNEEQITDSLFQYLEDNYASKPTQAYTILFLPEKDDPMLRRMGFPEGQQAFAFKQYYADARGNPLLCSVDYLKSDLFQFCVLRTAL